MENGYYRNFTIMILAEVGLRDVPRKYRRMRKHGGIRILNSTISEDSPHRAIL